MGEPPRGHMHGHRAHSGGNAQHMMCAACEPDSHTHHLTFAVGEVVGAGYTRVTPQSCHSRPAAALPTAGVAGYIQGAVGGAVAGWGGRRVGVGTEWAVPPPASCRDTHGHRRGSRGSQGCTPGRWCLCSQGGSDTPRLHCRAGPGPPGGRSRRLQETGPAMGTGVALLHPPPGVCRPPSLTSAVGVAVVAGATAVAVRAVELGPAQAAASLVAALGQGPRGAAATHCGARGTGCWVGRQDPGPPAPGKAVLTLAEGEVEVAGGAAVTRGALEACPARALARVAVTAAVHHSGAGALARCGRGHAWSRVRAGTGRARVGLHSRWQSWP